MFFFFFLGTLALTLILTSTKTFDFATDGFMTSFISPLPSGRSIMVIATYPEDKKKYASVWSQLQCFSDEFDKIIISSPVQFKRSVNDFLDQVYVKMPGLRHKTVTSFYVNDRYDLGLWCDSLLEGKYINIEGETTYDNFMLINDIVLAVENTNAFVSSLQKTQAEMISLNYWGEKNNNFGNDPEKKFWVESPLRVFSRDGMTIFVNKICALPKIDWEIHCPHLRINPTYKTYQQKRKRCIVELTEVNVVDHFDLDRVHGFFRGNDGKNSHWGNSFSYWNNLRGRGFPATKVSNVENFEQIKAKKRLDLERCTRGFDSWID